MTTLTFEVPGKPRPQGSRNWKVPVRNEALENYRARIAHEAVFAMDGRPPTASAVHVSVIFKFARPKSHYGTGRNAGQVKASARKEMTQRPDVDKLARAVLDGLTGVVYLDDQQVTALSAWKGWGTNGVDLTSIVVRYD